MSPVSPEPAAAEGIARRGMPVEYMDDLQDSLTRLGQLATGLLPLEESLTRLAEFAVRAIPGADGAGLTLLEENRSDTIVATAEFAAARSRPSTDAFRHHLRPTACRAPTADHEAAINTGQPDRSASRGAGEQTQRSAKDAVAKTFDSMSP
jgi:hypothetical protein